MQKEKTSRFAVDRRGASVWLPIASSVALVVLAGLMIVRNAGYYSGPPINVPTSETQKTR